MSGPSQYPPSGDSGTTGIDDWTGAGNERNRPRTDPNPISTIDLRYFMKVTWIRGGHHSIQKFKKNSRHEITVLKSTLNGVT